MTEKRGVLSRADLVKTLAKPETTEWLAEALCLAKPYQQEHLEVLDKKTIISEWVDTGDFIGGDQYAIRSETLKPVLSRPKTHFWYLADRDDDLQSNKEDSPEEVPEQETEAIINQDWTNRPAHPPQHIPLLETNALLARLRPFLKQDAAGRKIDLDKVVKTISRAEHLSNIPKKNKKRQQRHLHIIDDRSRHLTPYWKDHDLAKLALLQEVQGENISFSILMEGELQPQQLTEQGLDDWQCPSQSLVLALSDLGALQRYTERSANTWKILGQRLQQKQCTALALLPCARALVEPSLAHLFQRLDWQAGAQKSSLEDEQRLLCYLSPCIRIEPSLLRQMRIRLELPIELESIVWQSSAINSPHSVAATWEKESRDEYLDSFTKLSGSEKFSALSIIREWRQPLDKQIWYEELIGLSETCQQLPIIEADVDQTKNYFIALSEQFKSESILQEKLHTQAWCRRLINRLPVRCLNGSSTLQKIAERVFKDTPEYDQRGINPQNLPESTDPIKQAVLYQRGNALRLKQYEPFEIPEQGYSRWALIDMRHDFVQVIQADEVIGSLKIDDGSGIKLLKNHPITLRSDLETLHFKTMEAPENINIGRDGFGLYADIEFFEVDQRFRYIEPGRFMMGSPVDEKGRYDELESHRQVTLTEGYWLADTACTQALWEAVMNENPSEFKDHPENPVERVNWLRVQEFLSVLNEHILGLNVRLPSEAQWEYACRAGSSSPFNFMGDIDLDQVNYRGLWDAQKDIRGNYEWHAAARRKSLAGNHFPPNTWGLHQMHGNVLEWCFDEWQDNLGSYPEIDPVHAQFKSGAKPAQISNAGNQPRSTSVYTTEMLENATESKILRVLRGGSWSGFGGFCRSATRYRGGADGRYGGVGFRLALGLELRSSQIARSGLSEADSKRVAEQRLKAVQAGRGVASGDWDKIGHIIEANEFITKVNPRDNGWNFADADEPMMERLAKSLKAINPFGRKK